MPLDIFQKNIYISASSVYMYESCPVQIIGQTYARQISYLHYGRKNDIYYIELKLV